MSARLAAIGLCAAAVLSGCAVVDSTVAPRYDTVSRNFAYARNEAILLNIVRAAHRDPLSFATISQAIPTFANQTSLGLPSFFAGPPPVPSVDGRGVVFSDRVASNNTNISTQFTLSTNETHAFYQALLRPVDLYVVDAFIRQGYPRELLFWLFTDRVQVRIGGTEIGYEYNPLYNYGCPLFRRVPQHECFRDWAEIATITGLTVEEQPYFKSAGSQKGGKPQNEIVARVCFDPVLGQQGRMAMRNYDPDLLEYLENTYLYHGRSYKTLSPICGTKWSPTISHEDTLKFSVNGITFQIVPRSAYGIYQFLGELLRLDLSPNPIVPPRGYLERQVTPDLTTESDQHILDVVRSAGPQCFVWTHFFDGDYCVPQTASNTKRIIGLLAALTALQTTASDLAITPVVHTVN